MNVENILPQGKRCMIKAYEGATQSKAGLIMENTSNATAAPCRGTILKAGTKSEFKEGQDILFIRYSAYTSKIVTPEGEKEIQIVEDDDIIAVVTTGRKIKNSKK